MTCDMYFKCDDCSVNLGAWHLQGNDLHLAARLGLPKKFGKLIGKVLFCNKCFEEAMVYQRSQHNWRKILWSKWQNRKRSSFV